jgi:antitoxin component YwqK of YwqJK toxin-antitoxin module
MLFAFSYGSKVFAEDDENKYTIYNAPYPSTFSSDRQEVLESINNTEGKNISDGLSMNSSKGSFNNAQTYKQTTKQGEYVYFGTVKKGMPDGKGILYNYNDGKLELFYAGGFKKGQYNGYGIEFISNTIQTEGIYKNGLLNGKGIAYATSLVDPEENLDYQNSGQDANVTTMSLIPIPEIVYEGGFKKGLMSGDGKAYYTRMIAMNGGEVYTPESNYGPLMIEGSFKDDKPNGKATYYYFDGTVKYKGLVKKGLYNGKGTLYNKNGSVNYQGNFKNGEIE